MSTKQFIVMLGLDEKTQPRAAKFDLADADAVRKAAQLMGLSTALPKTEEQCGLTPKIAQGKLFASGRGLVPIVKQTVYDLLIAKLDIEPATEIETPKPAAQPTKQSNKQPLPQAWLDLKVGVTVIAPGQNPSDDGWWPGVITGFKGDQLVLKWIDAPKQKPATFPRSAVAILSPANAKLS